MRLTGTALAALVTLAAPLAAQDFSWSGRLAAGKELEIKGVNGWVRAEAATGDEIQVTANKRARDDDPADVKIEVVEHAGGVTICAVYPTPERSRHENECAPGSGGHMNTEDNDVKVDFTVKVPAGVRFTGQTVNGDVEAEGLGADVDVATVNGDVSVTTRGRAEASTVNGGITVRMGRADWTGDLSFHTVNGGITVYLPSDFSAEIEAQTVNGDIETEFPLTVSGRFGMRRIRGTVGQGGRTLELETENGSIRLRKQGST
jgi:hypothetical protein